MFVYSNNIMKAKLYSKRVLFDVKSNTDTDILKLDYDDGTKY